MADTDKPIDEKIEASAIYTDDGVVRESVVEALDQAISEDDSSSVQDIIRDLHESETADLLEAIEEEKRGKFVALSGEVFDYAALTEVRNRLHCEALHQSPRSRENSMRQKCDNLEQFHAEPQPHDKISRSQ